MQPNINIRGDAPEPRLKTIKFSDLKPGTVFQYRANNYYDWQPYLYVMLDELTEGTLTYRCFNLTRNQMSEFQPSERECFSFRYFLDLTVSSPIDHK